MNCVKVLRRDWGGCFTGSLGLVALAFFSLYPVVNIISSRFYVPQSVFNMIRLIYRWFVGMVYCLLLYDCTALALVHSLGLIPCLSLFLQHSDLIPSMSISGSLRTTLFSFAPSLSHCVPTKASFPMPQVNETEYNYPHRAVDRSVCGRWLHPGFHLGVPRFYYLVLFWFLLCFVVVRCLGLVSLVSRIRMAPLSFICTGILARHFSIATPGLPLFDYPGSWLMPCMSFSWASLSSALLAFPRKRHPPYFLPSTPGLYLLFGFRPCPLTLGPPSVDLLGAAPDHRLPSTALSHRPVALLLVTGSGCLLLPQLIHPSPSHPPVFPPWASFSAVLLPAFPLPSRRL